MNIVGIAGHKGAGKDTCADHLVARYGYMKFSFAAVLKDILNGLFGWRREDWESLDWKETPNPASYNKTPREIAQSFGTDWGRRMVNNDIWVDATLRYVLGTGKQFCVCSDVRFDNEAVAIRRLGGMIILLEKEGYVANDTHQSEAGISRQFVDARLSAPHGALKELRRAFEDLVIT